MDFYTVKNLNSRFPVLYTADAAEATEVCEVLSSAKGGYFVYHHTEDSLRKAQSLLSEAVKKRQQEIDLIEKFLKDHASEEA